MAHEVVKEEETEDQIKPSYQGSSPDEITLVETAADRGLTFVDYKNGQTRLKVAPFLAPSIIGD